MAASVKSSPGLLLCLLNISFIVSSLIISVSKWHHPNYNGFTLYYTVNIYVVCPSKIILKNVLISLFPFENLFY